MFKWLKNKMENTQQEEAIKFLNSLRGLDMEALDTVAAQTIYWCNYYQAKGLDLYSMEFWIHQNLLFPASIASTIKELQRSGGEVSVPGLLVWLHSSRALMYPELRIFGRDIWAELVKASDKTEPFAIELMRATNQSPLIRIDRTLVPTGLEKLNR